MNIQLKIKTFGYADIQYHDQSIFSEKQNTDRINSLLQYFLIKRDKLCKPEEIVEDLWPDNNYIDGKKVLHTYVHRLKNIISQKNVFHLDFSSLITITNTKGSYQMQISEEVELDTDVFMSLVDISGEILPEEALVEMACKLMEIYDGHFLQNSQHEQLVLRLQNNYLQLCCRAMSNLLIQLFEKRNYDEIIHLCENFFLVDDMNEEINLLFLKTLLKTQQNNYAARHFAYIEKKMQDMLDVSPPQEMYALFSTDGQSIVEPILKVDDPNEQNAVIDESRLKSMVEEIVTDRLNSNKAHSSFLCVEVLGTPPEGTSRLLGTLLLRTLRKNDIYAITGDNKAMALLHNAKEEHFDVIKKRISDCASSLFEGENIDLDISICNGLRIV